MQATGTQKQILLDFTAGEFASFLHERHPELPAFRAKQIFARLNDNVPFSLMTELPLALREKLAAEVIDTPTVIADTLTSHDGTKKFLYRLCDGALIEGVLMQNDYGRTLCVSTQVGCRMGCVFCASGLYGLTRQLSAGEILGQVLAANASVGGTAKKRELTNLVLMGMGEPLDNYKNVVKFLRLVNSADSLNISYRNISLSTCGLVDGIDALAEEGMGINLTISLHSADQAARLAVMPIAKRYDLVQLIAAAKRYFDKTGRRVLFEYVLLKGQNMSDADADKLATLVSGFPTHVNLIMLNGAVGGKTAPCTKQEAQAFLMRLERRNVSVTMRRSMGGDIEGACGQLRNKFVGDK